MSGKNNTKCVKCVVKIVTTSLKVLFGLQEVQLAFSKARKKNLWNQWEFSHPTLVWSYSLWRFAFWEGNCNSSFSSRGATGETKNKSAPTPRRVGCVFQKAAFLALGVEGTAPGKGKLQYFCGNNEAAPSEAAEFM